MNDDSDDTTGGVAQWKSTRLSTERREFNSPHPRFFDESILRPRQSSVAGFLNETESLSEVIETDRKTLEKFGLTYTQFADQLSELVKKVRLKMSASKSFEEEFSIDGLYLVRPLCYLGWQSCPFKCAGDEAKSSIDYVVRGIKIGETIFFSQLHPHLIREHKFFEGHTKYRLDPEKCALVLNLM